MTVVYALLFLIPICAEISSHIPTGGVIKKIWLGMVSLGGLLAWGGFGTDLICLGFLLHFTQTIAYNLKYRYRRRVTG